MEDWRWKNIQLEEKKDIKKLYLNKQKYHKVRISYMYLNN